MITLYRYANRRLYMPAAQVFVNGPQLIKWVRAGEDITVVCHQTKRDITTQTLLQHLSLVDLSREKLMEVIRHA